MKVNQNERSWVITLITHINIFLDNKTLKIKRADGERTINTGRKRMFPDILIYGDNDKQMIMQGWEVKMPDVVINDNAFYEDAKRKAEILNLNSFLMWNFSYGKLFVKNNGVFKEDKTWDLSAYIKTRSDVETHVVLWEKTIEDILFYINFQFEGKILMSSSLGDIISNKVMNDIIKRNISITSERLKIASSQNAVMRVKMKLWWQEVKVEYLNEVNDPYKAYSRLIILGWLNRFLFAHVIKKYHNPASIIEEIDFDTSIEDAIEKFNNVTQQCDFYNVFNIYEYSEYTADETWKDLVEFNLFLKDSNINKMEHESFQNILEGSVNLAKREILGQFTTPHKLAKLLIGVSINNISGNFIDPCCGTGTIAVEALKYKKSHINISEAFNTTWCSDKQSFPLQIASVNFTDSEAINTPSLIFQKNVFDLNENDPIIVTNPADGSKLEFLIPKFDTIASNLPFVSSNTKGRERNDLVISLIKKIQTETGINLSNRNDLYTYIILKLWDNLNDKGRLSVITSNSWFATDAGKQFFEVIKWYYKIIGLYISDKGKWFKNASIRTTVLLLEKKDINSPLDESIISFGKVTKKLEDISNDELDSVINSIVIGNSLDSNLIKINNYSNKFISEILEKNVSLNTLFHNVEWLPLVDHKLSNLSKFYSVYRGMKTGQDEIFLLNDKVDIDNEFILMGLKNSKKLDTLMCKSDTKVLSCHLTLEELKQEGKIKTYTWFNQYKNNLNKSLLIRKEKWNILDTSKVANLFTTMNPDGRLFFGRFENPTFINQRLVGLIKKNAKIDDELNHALLNSLIGLFYIEAIGFGRGAGALDFSKTNLSKIKMLNPDILNQNERSLILDAFKPLLNRKIAKLEQEIVKEDRINFDKTVLSVYGLSEYYEKIKNSLLSLQRNRLSIK